MADAIMLNGLSLPDNIGALDLGTYTWAKFTATGNYKTFFYAANFVNPGWKADGGINAASHETACSGYDQVSRNTVYYGNPNTGICCEPSGMYVGDPTLTDLTAGEFKSAMSGVMVFYRKADA